MAIELKDKMIGFRASKEEVRRVKKQAAALSLRLSEYIRLCILNDLENREARKEAERISA